MVEIRKLRGATSNEVAYELRKGLDELGFTGSVEKINPTAVKASQIRLGDKHIRKYGYNISPYGVMTGETRRGRVLGWRDWVNFNKMVNDVLDKLGASANAHSLGRKFVIRKGKRRYTEADWQDLAYENVGSQMYPVMRKDAWVSEETPRTLIKGRWKRKLREVVD